MRKLGYLPSPEQLIKNKPDWESTMKAAPVPTEGGFKLVEAFNNIPMFGATPGSGRILNQFDIGSCVLNSVFGAMRLRHFVEGVRHPSLGARLKGYLDCRAYHGMETIDSGTYIRTAFYLINELGFLPETLYTYGYDTRKFNEKYPPDVDMLSIDLREKNSRCIYRRILGTGRDRVDEIKRALAHDYPVVFGTQVSWNFVTERFDASRPVLPPRDEEELAGGHAMYLLFYSGDEFLGANSWDYSWGNEGRFWMSAEYLAHEYTQDIWYIEKAPNISEAA